ncbi:MAG: haloacid dehalogenase [Acidimicrobiaceae bacterium]|nr:haloacid dehalogenase [Acidimicrobiaceae bacterium]
MSGPIRLVLSDVDGTLVTREKDLTAEAINAVRQLNDAGILFAVTSGRPPKGLRMLIEPLRLVTPLGGFNGGLMADEKLDVLQELILDDGVVGPIIDLLLSHGLSVWVYQGTDWFVLDENGPHVARESFVCQFRPTQLEDFEGVRGDIVKIVGVSDEPAIMATATAELLHSFGDEVSATNSQTYYLDVTHRDANKGKVVAFLSKQYGIEPSQIATVGDMANDVLMFEKSGLSIAMGNASEEVKQKATFSTESNQDNGFALAIEKYILKHVSLTTRTPRPPEEVAGAFP